MNGVSALLFGNRVGKIVGYCGTLGVANALHNLVEVDRSVEKTNPELFFEIVGKGSEEERLNDLILKYALSNIKIYDAIPPKKVQSFFAKMVTYL